MSIGNFVNWISSLLLLAGILIAFVSHPNLSIAENLSSNLNQRSPERSERTDKLDVRWQTAARNSVVVSFNPPNAGIDKCIERGLIYLARYELQICSLRLLWLDDCRLQKIDKRISKDPISGVISLGSDRLRDLDQPKITEIASLSEGISELSNQSFTIDIPPSKRQGWVIKAHVNALCRGPQSGFFDRLPALLTLGFFSLGTGPAGDFDSSWTEFSLKD